MSTPLLVLYDEHGGITDAGDRGPLWSSDCRPATSLKGLCAELLQAGWPLSVMLQLPGGVEPEQFIDVYKREFGGKTPKNFDRHQRAAKMRDHMANTRDPYNTGLSDAALGGGKRIDYGTTKRVGDE